MQLRFQLGLLTVLLSSMTNTSTSLAEIHLAQGTMSGEVSEHSALLQTRLTATPALNAADDLPGIAGMVAFEWSEREDFSGVQRTPFEQAVPAHDFIVRTQLNNLKAATRYYFRAVYGADPEHTQPGGVCSFKTLPGAIRKTTTRTWGAFGMKRMHSSNGLQPTTSRTFIPFAAIATGNFTASIPRA